MARALFLAFLYSLANIWVFLSDCIYSVWNGVPTSRKPSIGQVDDVEVVPACRGPSIGLMMVAVRGGRQRGREGGGGGGGAGLCQSLM